MVIRVLKREIWPVDMKRRNDVGKQGIPSSTNGFMSNFNR